jgi:cytoskeletal protein RodZ
MQQQLIAIGQTFKGKREEMNLSLKEVENATSIRKAYIEAIEEGTGEKFLSPVYVVGFIKQYATFLGIDVNKLITDHPEAFQVKPQQQEFSYGIGTLETRGAPKGSGRLIPTLLYGGLTIIVLAMAYYFARYVGVL